MDEITPEQQAKINLVRILVGDVEQSIFYPVLSDEEYFQILEANGWNIQRAARSAAMSIAFQLSAFPYRERAGDIEVWNNASIQYLKVLTLFLDNNNPLDLPQDIMPYAAGISRSDVRDSNCNPDKNRSPLARISPCTAWWTDVKNYDLCCNDNILNLIR